MSVGSGIPVNARANDPVLTGVASANPAKDLKG